MVGYCLQIARKDCVITGIDEFPRRVHAEGRFIPPELDDDNTFVEANCHLISVFAKGNAPRPFKTVAEGVFDAVGPTVPNLDRAIFTSTDDNGQVGVEDSKRNVIGVSLHGLHTGLAEIIPYFDSFVIASRNKVGFVRAWIEIDVVNALFVGFHGEVWARGT